MERYILKVSYLGNNYSGFQIQQNKDTIQQRLETALSEVCKQNIKIVSSGRTDAGVSALCQVCHFDTSEPIVCHKVLSYANALLPQDIRVLEIESANADFHARYSSKKKTYQYYSYVGMNNAVYDHIATHIGLNVSIDDMKNACKLFEGEHDFESFCASNTDVKDKVRVVYKCDIESVNDNLYRLEITGNGFLYNMVRIIMGTLVEIGKGKKQAEDVTSIINAKDRSLAGKTMPSKGLVLKNVVY